MLRKFQQEFKQIAERIKCGEDVRYICADVTQGGGKSSVAAILNSVLPEYKICWIVPRDALRVQGEEAYTNPKNVKLYGNSGYLRAATNEQNPRRGQTGYITTYQSVINAPELHKAEIGSERYILILDECHHIPAPGSTILDEEDPSTEVGRKEKAFYSAIAPLVERAALTVFMTGSMERHGQEKLGFIPYKTVLDGQFEMIDTEERSRWAFIQYKRSDAIADNSVLPFAIHASNGPVEWTDNGDGRQLGVKLLSKAGAETHSGALMAALEGTFAEEMLRGAIDDWKDTKRSYPPAKMLVIAANIRLAVQYHEFIKSLGISTKIATDNTETLDEIGLAHSDDNKQARRSIRHFRGEIAPECDILVSVAMAYEGLDVPTITHVVCLTNYRSKPWIEQAVTRCNRIDYKGIASGLQKPDGKIFVPSDAKMLDLISLIDYGLPKVVRHEIGAPEFISPAQKGREIATYTHIRSAVSGTTIFTIDGQNELRMEEMRRNAPEQYIFDEELARLMGNVTSDVNKRRAKLIQSLDARITIHGTVASSADPSSFTMTQIEDAYDKEINQLVAVKSGRNPQRKIRLLAFLKKRFGPAAERTVEMKLKTIAYLKGEKKGPEETPELQLTVLLTE